METKQLLREVIMQRLLKKKVQKQVKDHLNQLSQQYPQIKKGLAHNQFGCICLTSGQLQKAEEHLLISQKLISPFIQYSNIYMNLGNLYAQKRNYFKAIQYFQKVLNNSPYTKELPCKQNFEKVIYSPSLNSYNAYVDCHTNLAVMYSHTEQSEKGFQFCKKAIELNPNNMQAQVNFGDILRQIGKKNEAIQHTWDQIVKFTKQNENQKYQRSKWIVLDQNENKKALQIQQKFINILVVKWGKRYDADYVNKLYAGIQRNTTWKFKFYCFTDDSQGLKQQIIIMNLEEGWTGWWGKVTLFKDYPQIKGRKFYIDLDMIITDNLDELFSYDGSFGTLKTDDIACQKQHKGGYNSSIMIWKDSIMLPVYESLKNNFANIKKFIVRFDFWLQMNVKNADLLQDIFPNQISDYLQSCQQSVPDNTRIVCFPRKPKPDEYPSQWIKTKWVL